MAVWVCLVIFLFSLGVMWFNALASLITTGGFKGIAGWLSWGIIFVMIRFVLLAVRVQKRSQETKSQQVRLWLLFGATLFNLVANGFALYLIVTNLQSGRLAWIKWDYLCSAVAIATLELALMGYFAFQWSRTQVMVLLVLGTRAFQQMCLVLSPQLHLIPAGTLWGLVGVAGQQTIVSFLEYRIATQTDSRSVGEARLVLFADVINVVSALVPLIWWYIPR